VCRLSECDGMSRFTDYAVALQQKIARLCLLTLTTGASSAVQTVQRIQFTCVWWVKVLRQITLLRNACQCQPQQCSSLTVTQQYIAGAANIASLSLPIHISWRHIAQTAGLIFSFFSAPQNRSHDFWRRINLYVCMYAEHGPRSVCPVGRQQQ